MKFNKSFILMIVLSLSMIVMFACSGGGSSESSSSDSGKKDKGNSGNKETVQLDFWDMVWGPPEYIETAKKIVEQFNEEHPGIEVTYQSVPWSNFYQTFSTAIASGTAPDISTGSGYQAFQFYDEGEILPIDDVIEEWEAEGKLDDFYEGSVETLKYDDHYVALPWALDTRVLWYRSDILEEAGIEEPKTWDELREAMKAVSKDGKFGFATPSDTGGTHYLYSLMIANGGGIFDENGNVDFMNEKNVEAIQFFADLVADGSVNPAGAGYIGDDVIKSFGQGDTVMHIANPGTRTRLPEIKDNIKMASPLTSFNGTEGTVFWINNIMVYKQTEHPDEAKTFLKWWSENSLGLWTEGHSDQLTARKSFSEDEFFQGNEDIKKVYDEYIPVAKTTAAHLTGAFPELNEIEGEGVMQTLTQELVMGKDPKEAMEKADKVIKEIMGE